MILVTLGTQDKKFTRLLIELDRLIDEKVIKDQVIVQAGYSKSYKTKHLKLLDLLSKVELENLVKEADFVITHGGVGSILTSLKYSKKVIAIPRLQKYKEHVNDHQIQIVNNFNEEGYIIGINDVQELASALEKIKTFKPRKYNSNNKNVLKQVKKMIDE